MAFVGIHYVLRMKQSHLCTATVEAIYICEVLLYSLIQLMCGNVYSRLCGDSAQISKTLLSTPRVV